MVLTLAQGATRAAAPAPFSQNTNLSDVVDLGLKLLFKKRVLGLVLWHSSVSLHLQCQYPILVLV